MYRCLLINRWWLKDSLVENYIQRTSCLDLAWSGAYSEEALHELQSGSHDLVIASLPSPDHVIPESILSELRGQESLILTAMYPEYLFSSYNLNSLFFLKEPFAMGTFQQALEKYISSTYAKSA